MLGPDHPDTLISAVDLGDALLKQEQYEKAETLYRRALEGREKLLGPGHADVLDVVSSLGIALHKQGQYEKAEAMHRRGLEGREKLLGSEHQKTLDIVDNLGIVLENLGQHEKDGEMHQRHWKDEKISWAPTIQTLFIALTTWASFFLNKWSTNGRKHCFVGHWKDERMHFGPYHPHTLASMENLALALSHQGRYQEAAMARRAIEAQRRAPGTSDSTVTGETRAGVGSRPFGYPQRRRRLSKLSRKSSSNSCSTQ